MRSRFRQAQGASAFRAGVGQTENPENLCLHAGLATGAGRGTKAVLEEAPANAFVLPGLVRQGVDRTQDPANPVLIQLVPLQIDAPGKGVFEQLLGDGAANLRHQDRIGDIE